MPPRCFLLASSWSMIPPLVVSTRYLKHNKIIYNCNIGIFLQVNTRVNILKHHLMTRVLPAVNLPMNIKLFHYILLHSSIITKKIQCILAFSKKDHKCIKRHLQCSLIKVPSLNASLIQFSTTCQMTTNKNNWRSAVAVLIHVFACIMLLACTKYVFSSDYKIMFCYQS